MAIRDVTIGEKLTELTKKNRLNDEKKKRKMLSKLGDERRRCVKSLTISKWPLFSLFFHHEKLQKKMKRILFISIFDFF